MEKTLDLSKVRDQRNRRRNMHVWRNLNHLKRAYSPYIKKEEIDEIAALLVESGRFKKRDGIDKEENEGDLCNIVEYEIINRLEKRNYKIKGKT